MTEEKLEYIRMKKGNATSKTKNTTQVNKSKGNGERRETKKISRQDKTIQTKQDIPKERKKILLAEGRDYTKTYQHSDNKETKQFWSKIWKRREHNRKAEWIDNMVKVLEVVEEGHKAKIQHRFPQRSTQRRTKLENNRQ